MVISGKIKKVFRKFIFWFCIGALAYVYVGYPLVVYLVSRIRPRPINAFVIEPKVTILITAFNEEAAIRAKIENTLAIDYPKEKLEIMVASDGSVNVPTTANPPAPSSTACRAAAAARYLSIITTRWGGRSALCCISIGCQRRRGSPTEKRPKKMGHSSAITQAEPASLR